MMPQALDPRRLYSRARSRVIRPIKNRLFERAGLRRIDDTDPTDIFIAGYPKSGNTWFQNLTAGIVYGLDPSRAPDELVQEVVPDVHDPPYYRRYLSPGFFRTHHLPRPEYGRVVYLLRDGRDVMVSYFHHLQAMEPGRYDFTEMIAEGAGLFPCKWPDHVEAWFANPHQAQMIVIRYEDLKRDTARELGRFCEFFGIARSPAEIAQVAAQCTFEQLRQKEARMGWANPLWPKDKPFIRRGQVGSHRDEMPPAALELFLSSAGPVLREHGYA